MLVASFTGGVEDYEIWWDKDGGAIDSTEGTDAAGNVVSYVDTAEAGVYTVHGVDSMYATASASVTVTAPKLTIVRQPEGGTIPKDGHAEINVLVADGEGPYQRPGVEVDDGVDASRLLERLSAGLAQPFHPCLRQEELPHADVQRPVLYGDWQCAAEA